MKTPREILLQRHQSAMPKLDKIRGGVLAMTGCEKVSGETPATATETVALPGRELSEWRVFVRSARWHLAGLGVAWAAVVVLNLDAPANTEAMISRDKIPAAKQLWAAVRENRRLLIEDSEAPASAEAPATPGRRSEIQSEHVVI